MSAVSIQPSFPVFTGAAIDPASFTFNLKVVK